MSVHFLDGEKEPLNFIQTYSWQPSRGMEELWLMLVSHMDPAWRHLLVTRSL